MMNSIGEAAPKPLLSNDGGTTPTHRDDGPRKQHVEKEIHGMPQCKKKHLGFLKKIILVAMCLALIMGLLSLWQDDNDSDDEDDDDSYDSYEEYLKYHLNGADDDEFNGCEVTPDDFLDWDQLTPEKQRIYKSRYYTKEIWDDPNRGPCDPPVFFGKSENFHPLVVPMNISAVQAINMSVLETLDVPVRLFDFYHHSSKDPTVTTYEVVDEMPMKTYMKDYVYAGNASYYLLLEDRMHEKKNIQNVVGTNIVQHMEHAIDNNPALIQAGLWNPVWSGLPPENYRWALFLGAVGTRTEMHLDTDVFNFLYVVQGKKRVVIVPNDERNQGAFGEIKWSASGGEGQLDYRLLDTHPLPEFAVEIELGPGQGLAIPYLAWHAVENLEPTLAYSVRVLDGRRRRD